MPAKRVILGQDLTPLQLPGTRGIVAAQCIRAGNHVYLAGQTAFDLDGRLVGLGDPAVQARQACENIAALVERAGGTLSDVVKLVVYLTDRAHREATWSVIRAHFPDLQPCGTEYVVRGLAHAGLLVELDAWAFVDDGETRKQLLRTQEVGARGEPGGGRAAQAYRAGNLVYLQGQAGRTLDGSLVGPGDAERQARQAMENIRALMEQAGGSLGDVVRVVRAVTTREDRATTYPAIYGYLADPPPPGTGLVVDGLAADALKIVVDAWGFIDTPQARKRVIRTHDLGAAGMLGATGRATQCVRAGNLVFVQGQVGWTLEGELVAPGDPAGQARQAMENIAALMELAGGSIADVVRVVVYVTDRAVREAAYPVIRGFWNDLWPCGTGIVVKGLARPEMLIEIDAYGFIDGAG
jgi:enamine deaminase RidA (YjgF/YER057c/UK114 family)